MVSPSTGIQPLRIASVSPSDLRKLSSAHECRQLRAGGMAHQKNALGSPPYAPT